MISDVVIIAFLQILTIHAHRMCCTKYACLVCLSLHPKQDNTTPLFVASQQDHQDVVQRLLGAGADMNILHMPSVSVKMLLLIVIMQEICE